MSGDALVTGKHMIADTPGGAGKRIGPTPALFARQTLSEC